MDPLNRYREIVSRLVEEYAGYKPAYGDVRTEAVVDRDHDHYEVVQVGWDGGRRVHGSVIHIDIRGGKVWIEHNGTDARLGEDWSRPASLAATSCSAFIRGRCRR